jgi:hypothetical protein
MSEFTSGYICLASDKEKLQASLKALDSKAIPYILHPVNEKYLGLFVDGLNQNTATIAGQLLIEASKQFPIMYFDNAEDHGWTYKLYVNRKIASQISLQYDLDENMVIGLLEQELEPNDGIDFYAHNDTDAYRQKVHASIVYKLAIKLMYSKLNLGAFKVFGIDKQKIQQLKAILTSNSYHVFEDRKRQVDKFKEIIGIPEMGWISYRYLKRDRDQGNLK